MSENGSVWPGWRWWDMFRFWMDLADRDSGICWHPGCVWVMRGVKGEPRFLPWTTRKSKEWDDHLPKWEDCKTRFVVGPSGAQFQIRSYHTVLSFPICMSISSSRLWLPRGQGLDSPLCPQHQAQGWTHTKWINMGLKKGWKGMNGWTDGLMSGYR